MNTYTYTRTKNLHTNRHTSAHNHTLANTQNTHTRTHKIQYTSTYNHIHTPHNHTHTHTHERVKFCSENNICHPEWQPFQCAADAKNTAWAQRKVPHSRITIGLLLRFDFGERRRKPTISYGQIFESEKESLLPVHLSLRSLSLSLSLRFYFALNKRWHNDQS